MNIREQSEELERKYLSPYASLSCESQGREREEEQCDIRTDLSERQRPYYTLQGI